MYVDPVLLRELLQHIIQWHHVQLDVPRMVPRPVLSVKYDVVNVPVDLDRSSHSGWYVDFFSMPPEIGVCTSQGAENGFDLVKMGAFPAQQQLLAVHVHIDVLVSDLCAVIAACTSVAFFYVEFLNPVSKDRTSKIYEVITQM